MFWDFLKSSAHSPVECEDHFLETREAITKFLFLKNDPAPVDLCFVLGSPSISSIEPAIDLYLQGFTQNILISGYGPLPQQTPESQSYKTYAIENGVPEKAILTEDCARNTFENFVFSAPIIETALGWKNIQTVAIAAKPFHMRRALMTALRQWPKHVRYIMRPSNYPDDPPAETWWQTEAGRRFVLSELRAIGTYALEDHIGGF
jgi:uncharacterized SAM-binding protein YcdF (DUF218 family)